MSLVSPAEQNGPEVSSYHHYRAYQEEPREEVVARVGALGFLCPVLGFGDQEANRWEQEDERDGANRSTERHHLRRRVNVDSGNKDADVQHNTYQTDHLKR